MCRIRGEDKYFMVISDLSFKIIDMVRCIIYADARARVAKWAVGKVGSAAGGARFISTYAYVLESYS
jgi:hypothetical protein